MAFAFRLHIILYRLRKTKERKQDVKVVVDLLEIDLDLVRLSQAFWISFIAGIIFFASYVSQLWSYHFPSELLSLQVAAPLSRMKYLFHAPVSVMVKLM